MHMWFDPRKPHYQETQQGDCPNSFELSTLNLNAHYIGVSIQDQTDEKGCQGHEIWFSHICLKAFQQINDNNIIWKGQYGDEVQ